jgi:hypothetical protein
VYSEYNYFHRMDFGFSKDLDFHFKIRLMLLQNQ